MIFYVYFSFVRTYCILSLSQLARCCVFFSLVLFCFFLDVECSDFLDCFFCCCSKEKSA